MFVTLYLYRRKQVIENRKRLSCIIECIMLCGRQELVLRDHRDFGSILFDDKLYCKNYSQWRSYPREHPKAIYIFRPT